MVRIRSRVFGSRGGAWLRSSPVRPIVHCASIVAVAILTAIPAAITGRQESRSGEDPGGVARAGRAASVALLADAFDQQIAAGYTAADGLPSPDVLAIGIDGGGRVWAGTRRGLARFEGRALEPRDVLERGTGVPRRDGRFVPVAALGSEPVTALAALEGDLFAAAGHTVWRLAPDGGAPERAGRVPVAAPILDIGAARSRSASSGGSGDALAPIGVVAGERDGGRVRHRSEILAATAEGLYSLAGTVEGEASEPRIELTVDARRVAVAPDGCQVAIAAAEGLFERGCGGREEVSGIAGTASLEPRWIRLIPHGGVRSWAPIDVHAVAYADDGSLWFGSPQGVGRRAPSGGWELLTSADGLPSNDLTSAVPARGGIWLGARLGAIRAVAPRGWQGAPASRNAHRADDDAAGAATAAAGELADPDAPARLGRRATEWLWEYRQGQRWLPHDEVRDLAVAPDGTVWIATAGGVGRIATVPMTLAEKARLFEEEIDRYHRRTPYGYVDAVRLPAPGDRSRFEQRSSDNDGLWTGMYGAGECFAYAATRRPEAKARAVSAFRALAFLSEVTQGGSHPAPPGFIARSILPIDGPDPNLGRPEEDRRRRSEEDALWKVIAPRWPVDATGRWYWKTDASSDELDGHFFLYALYHDLVAESAAERAEVRDVVTRIVDHLLQHDYSLVDHDGQPTRWAVFGPGKLNHDPDWWGERGLNSLSLLSYLRVAAHVSGDAKYDRAARELIERHGYAANVRAPKVHTGPGTGNQSDDEMAFMSFWNLLRYERDPELRATWGHAFHRYWLMERPERNPLFAFLYAASVRGLLYRDAFDTVRLGIDAGDEALDDARDTLERYPLDRVDWGLRNSHREDVVPLGAAAADDGDDGAARPPARGLLRSGKVLPIDERFVDHWNHDPWRLDQGGEGRSLADGASFLLPYYLGLHEGFLSE